MDVGAGVAGVAMSSILSGSLCGVTIEPLTISLPIADRGRSFAFYQDALGLVPFGDEIAADGFPEPLQFALNEHTNLMLIPTGGFGWVIGDDRTVAGPGTSECVLSVSCETTVAVDAQLERARQAGATVVEEPTAKPWAYLATFADPDGHLWMVAQFGHAEG